MKKNPSELLIGEVARRLKVNIQTLRYYERKGLLKPLGRRFSGYRVYDESSVERVAFIRRAQGLGFPLAEIKELLSLQFSSPTARARVRKKAEVRLVEVRGKVRALRALDRTLSALIDECARGAPSGPCPILEKMEGKRG